MGCKIDCAQIVLIHGIARDWRSAALQPGQPPLGILDLGQAGVGVIPEVEDCITILLGLSKSCALTP